jgi:hypothetical protein
MEIARTGQVDLGYLVAKELFDGLLDSVSVRIPAADGRGTTEYSLPILSFGNGQFMGTISCDGRWYEITLTRIGVTGKFDFVRSAPRELW